MKNQDKFSKFYTHCPHYQQLKDYAEAKLPEKEEEKVIRQLNQCNQENCKCEEMIEGIQLASYAEKLTKERPELLMNYDEQKIYKNLLPKIEEAFPKNPTPNFTVHKNGHSAQKKTLTQNFRFLGLAAAAVILLLVTVWIYNQQNQHKDKKIISNNRDNVIPERDTAIQNENKANVIDSLPPQNNQQENKTNEQEIKENNTQQNLNTEELLAFEPNLALESLVNNNMRGTQKEVEITQITPANEVNVTQKIRFEWNPSRQIVLTIEILDNKNQLVKELIIPMGQNFAEVEVNIWKKGLYYWKLYDENELYHTGKFTVKK